MKLSVLFPVFITALPTFGFVDTIPDKFSSWGVVGILAWFLFYTVKFWIPAIEERKRAELAAQRADLVAMSLKINEDFLKTLKTIRKSGSMERKAIRRILRDVVETEKNQMEMILKLSQSLEVLFKEREQWREEIMDAIRERGRKDQ